MGRLKFDGGFVPVAGGSFSLRDETGPPRTGIVDALIAKIRPDDADGIDIRLVQLKSGSGGLLSRRDPRQ